MTYNAYSPENIAKHKARDEECRTEGTSCWAGMKSAHKPLDHFNYASKFYADMSDN